MPDPMPVISLRLSEEEVVELDSMIGIEGTRNRTQVIRLALHRLKGVESLSQEVVLALGGRSANQIHDLCEMYSTNTQGILTMALNEFYHRELKREVESANLRDEIRLVHAQRNGDSTDT